jgi:hypothetical protein
MPKHAAFIMQCPWCFEDPWQDYSDCEVCDGTHLVCAICDCSPDECQALQLAETVESPEVAK